MTMPFSVHDPKGIFGFRIGDAISFHLTATDQDSWIDQIKKINIDEVRLPTPTAAPEIRLTKSGAAMVVTPSDIISAIEKH